jgi:hypothetical protein
MALARALAFNTAQPAQGNTAKVRWKKSDAHSTYTDTAEIVVGTTA